ncbi:hypothetical protein VKT23_000003 [Stygiomarasmius scandens]|uniref:Uncharacterized protein n=1 Tax=Marasmiellus scandens TaxID=2682957 RepID=A0ABR1K6W6_9AGAR
MPERSCNLVRKTRSGNTFAIWDGVAAITAPQDFDLVKTVSLAQSLTPEPDRIQDLPPLEPSDAISITSSDSSPLSSPPSSRPATPDLLAVPSIADSTNAYYSSSPIPSLRLSGSQSGLKRKRKSRRSKKKALNVAPTSPTQHSGGGPKPKKSTARSHFSRGKQRADKQLGPTAYECRPSTAEKKTAASSPICTNFDTGNMLTSTSGYIGRACRINKDTLLSKREWSVDELCGANGLGFQLISVDQSTGPLPLINGNGIVFGCAVPPPKDNQWDSQATEAATAALERERDGYLPESNESCGKRGRKRKRKAGLSFKSEELDHRRGKYGAKADGISAGGGQTHPKRIHHSKKTTAALNRLRHERAFVRIAGHASAAFAHWSPKLFQYYSETIEKLKAHDPSLQFNFPNSIFACATYNVGPQTISVEHLDYMNYIYGWCSVTSLGHFNYKKGGHLILWDLKVVIEFPPGWTMLIPSAYLRHSNTTIGPGETRYSFTQYTAGAIFRYVEDGFQMRSQMNEHLRNEAEARQRDRIQNDLNMYSTLDELKALYLDH